jgi:hypothetical protein
MGCYLYTCVAAYTERSLDFELSYMVSPASWQAEYDLRVERAAPAAAAPGVSVGEARYAVRVGLYAVVAQATAEDWQNVRLHLSTSQAQQRIVPPTPPTRQALVFRQDYGYAGEQESAGGGAQMRLQSARSKRMFKNAAVAQEFDAGAAPMAFEAAADMAVMGLAGVGVTGGAGQVGSPVVFHPQHRVNISSNHQGGGGGGYGAAGAVYADPKMSSAPVTSTVTRSTRIYIQDTVLNPTLFTYAVPTSGDKTAYLKAWTSAKPSNNGNAKGTQSGEGND